MKKNSYYSRTLTSFGILLLLLAFCPSFLWGSTNPHRGGTEPVSPEKSCLQSVLQTETLALDKLEKRPAIVLNTSRLIIRTPTKRDLAPLLPIFQDRQTVQYTWFNFEPGEVRWTESSLRERFEWQASEELKANRYDFVMHLNDTEKTVMGRCALYRPEKMGDWEFGITIGRDFWKKGYGEETTRAVMDYAFDLLQAKNVFLEVLPENKAMQDVCKRMKLRMALPAKDADPAGPFLLKYDYYALDREAWQQQQIEKSE